MELMKQRHSVRQYLDAPIEYEKRQALDALVSEMNQQKFFMELTNDGTVKASCKTGFYTKLDLGIVKYHFELGAGTANFKFK